MAHSIRKKNRAVILRKKGHSLSAIADKLKISKGTASVWLKNVQMSSEARRTLTNTKQLAQEKANETKRRNKEILLKKVDEQSKHMISSMVFSQDHKKILCSLLFWAEGSKGGTCVSFINSDPKMIALFLDLLRDSFSVDEKKFRGMVHIHEYHQEEEILAFWSRVSRIPLSQFSKSYEKPHTKKRKKDGYKGSFRVRYYDSRVARELHSIYTTLPDFLSGM